MPSTSSWALMPSTQGVALSITNTRRSTRFGDASAEAAGRHHVNTDIATTAIETVTKRSRRCRPVRGGGAERVMEKALQLGRPAARTRGAGSAADAGEPMVRTRCSGAHPGHSQGGRGRAGGRPWTGGEQGEEEP